jgi:hypothetical protein
MLLEGSTSHEVNQIIFGGNLIALDKKDGGVRPIAIGYVLRRLTAKVASRKMLPKATNLFAPRQLGFGTPRGSEAAIHATRHYVQNLSASQLVVKLDFKNAFNSIRRDEILHAVARDFPEIYRFVHSSYSNITKLKYGDNYINSEQGVQQGDPLGPLLFCATLQPLLMEMKSELTVGYLDDLTLGGMKSVVEADIDRVCSEGSKLGLCLNKSKCEVLSAYDRNIINEGSLHDFVSVRQEDATLLGAPLIPGPAVTKAIQSRSGVEKTYFFSKKNLGF